MIHDSEWDGGSGDDQPRAPEIIMIILTYISILLVLVLITSTRGWVIDLARGGPGYHPRWVTSAYAPTIYLSSLSTWFSIYQHYNLESRVSQIESINIIDCFPGNPAASSQYIHICKQFPPQNTANIVSYIFISTTSKAETPIPEPNKVHFRPVNENIFDYQVGQKKMLVSFRVKAPSWKIPMIWIWISITQR